MTPKAHLLEMFYARCLRCGELWTICPHPSTRSTKIDEEHAERIKARYALGLLHNPNHDTTSYVDPGFPHKHEDDGAVTYP